MKRDKLYIVLIDFGIHRGSIETDQINFTLWIRELAKEFKIHTKSSPSGKFKTLYIYNYWGDKQAIGYIYSK